MFQDWNSDREWQCRVTEDRAKLRKIGEQIEALRRDGKKLRGWFWQRRYGQSRWALTVSGRERGK